MRIMEKEKERIYLAALLHDIGKFYQRADTGSVQTSKYLKEHGKDESMFCPKYGNRYTHKHVLWTVQFIEDFSQVFKNLLHEDSDILSFSNKDSLLSLAGGHHLGNAQLSMLGRIIKKADCLSSGMDRDSDEALKDEKDELETNWDSFKQKRMVSILQTIHNTECKEWQHLPIGKMELSKNYFPKNEFAQSPDYTTLWHEFQNEFKFIQANTYHAFSETFLNLLQKYTSCIPASTINFPDVSLFDHLKTTAALAVCLYDFQQTGEANAENPFLLIGADFSGIQPYIYQIVSKYAGKNLKGRSFYLRLLSDAVVRYLLKELHLFQANVVYNSGGGFYLLAPNTPFIKEQLEKSIAFIEKSLFETHGTALYAAIDSIELSENALMHKNGETLGDIWGKLFQKRDKKKSAKFATLIESNYTAFFEPILQGGEMARDSITGEEFLPNEKVFTKENLKLKAITNSQIEIGKKLRETNLLVVKEDEPLPYWNNKVHISPANLGYTYYFLNDSDLNEMKEELCASADKVSVVTLNGKNGNCDFLKTIDGINNIYGLDFYGGNEADTKNIPTFEEMCENANFSRMGVLRMDVDNLGAIFQKGISPERATLSRYAALSRSFDFFFSGYLNTIWRETDPNRSFIIYSGGDDVFIVGSWDVTIQLAEKIRNDFREFTCYNPAFSLSGGIAIVPPKFPIMKGAEESAKEEESAKSHTITINGENIYEKNSLSFMDMPLNWDVEYPKVKEIKSKLVELLQKEKLPKSFLSKIMAHYANAQIVNHTITKYKTYWMLTYDLSRMKNRSDKEVTCLIDNCIFDVCNGKKTLNREPIQSDYQPLELWNFAVRWAELEYRKNINKK